MIETGTRVEQLRLLIPNDFACPRTGTVEVVVAGNAYVRFDGLDGTDYRNPQPVALYLLQDQLNFRIITTDDWADELVVRL